MKLRNAPWRHQPFAESSIRKSRSVADPPVGCGGCAKPLPSRELSASGTCCSLLVFCYFNVCRSCCLSAAVCRGLACIVGCFAQLPCTADGARGHVWWYWPFVLWEWVVLSPVAACGCGQQGPAWSRGHLRIVATSSGTENWLSESSEGKASVKFLQTPTTFAGARKNSPGKIHFTETFWTMSRTRSPLLSDRLRRHSPQVWKLLVAGPHACKLRALELGPRIGSRGLGMYGGKPGQ